MNQRKHSKLNWLMQNWPRGTVCTASWLNDHGIAWDLVDRYRRSGWVASIGWGAVVRQGDRVDWLGAVYAVQEQLGVRIHPAAKSSLQMQGLAHSVPLGRQKVYMFGAQGVRLPAWFRKGPWEVEVRLVTTNLFPVELDVGLRRQQVGDFPVRISSPERAIMEVLHMLSRDDSLDETMLLMENLATLVPSTVQVLLEACRSVKVKRLFMILAEKVDHNWVRKLELTNINFGKGRRSFVRGGILHPKYHMTVPRTWIEKGSA